MTPCEKIGLKVGDKIRVLQKGRVEPVGSVLTLIRDDGSKAPLFETEGGETTFFGVIPDPNQRYLPEGRGWERVVDEKHDLPEKLRHAIAKRDKQAEKAKRHADKLEQSEAEVQRLIGELEREIEEATGLACSIKEPLQGGIPESSIPKGAITHGGIPDGVDVDDPSTWERGDVISYIGPDSEFFTIGREYVFTRIDPRDDSVEVEQDDAGDTYGSPRAKFRFVRRPS